MFLLRLVVLLVLVLVLGAAVVFLRPFVVVFCSFLAVVLAVGVAGVPGAA